MVIKRDFQPDLHAGGKEDAHHCRLQTRALSGHGARPTSFHQITQRPQSYLGPAPRALHVWSLGMKLIAQMGRLGTL
jgi:hypothetical protein